MEQVLNLVRPEESSVEYTISKFPDGEIQIKLGELDRKHEVLVKCRITSAEDLFILQQVGDILDRQEIIYTVWIYYLMGMRMDRVMDFNRPYTLKIVMDILNSLKNASEIAVFSPHSDKYMWMCNHMYPLQPNNKNTVDLPDEYIVVLPDQGAIDRCVDSEEVDDTKVVMCNKVRDVETGKLLGFKVLNPDVVKNATVPLMLIDDLCDGGGTFVGIAEKIREINPNVELYISVSHMVSRRGINNLSKHYKGVFFTNSYKDWEDLPENCQMIKVV